MRCDARQYARLARHGPATAIRVQPTGTAVTDYQVPLGNRHSLREAGVIGLPSWSDKTTQTETWVRVPRLSATCPQRIVAFDGGRGNIDRCMEFGDEFGGSALDTAKWGTSAAAMATVSGGAVTVHSTTEFVDRGIYSTVVFGLGCSVRARARQTVPGTAGSYPAIGFADAVPCLSEETSIFAFNGSSINQWSLKTMTAGTATHTHFASGFDTAYHTFDILRHSSVGAAGYVDGAVRSSSTNISAAGMRAKISSYHTVSDAVVAWLIVRKYIANEPIAGTAAPTATNRALSRPLSAARAMQMAVAG